MILPTINWETAGQGLMLLVGRFIAFSCTRMSERMKRVISFILACVMACSLTSCGKKELSWQEQYDLGVRYLSDGNYQEAIIAFTAAIEIDEMNVTAYVGRGQAYLGLLDYEEAKNDYMKAIELDSSHEGAYLGLSQLYQIAGNLNAAIHSLYDGFLHCEDKNDMLLNEYRGIFVPYAKQEYYMPDGTLDRYYEYDWDNIGRLLSVSRYSYMVNGETAEPHLEGGEWVCDERTEISYDDVSETTTYAFWTYMGGYGDTYTEDGSTGKDNINHISSGLSSDRISVAANPYSIITDEDTIYRDWEGGAYSLDWEYAAATYDKGLITRIDCFDEAGSSTGYVLIYYEE